MIYCKDCSTTDCPYQKEKEERENNPFKKILGCNEDEVQHHRPRKRGGISMSDILIKGMEMPTKQVLVVINPDGLVEILSSDNILIEEFQAIPAADVRPVKRGKWIDTDNYYQRWKCSACGCHTRDAAPNFCPNCGADMRGENDV